MFKRQYIVLIILLLLLFTIGCESKEVQVSSSTEVKEVSLIVKREKYMGGLFIDYSVYLDGEKIGQISNGKQKEYSINLTYGEHEIYIKKGIRSKKLKFNVDEDTSEFKFACKTKSTFGIDIWNDYEE